MVRLYGKQCARCGTIMLAGEMDRSRCARCTADERDAREALGEQVGDD